MQALDPLGPAGCGALGLRRCGALMGRRIIAVTGYAQTGKSTTAAMLCEEGYELLESRSLLAGVLYATNPWVPDGNNAMVRLQELVDRIGWERAKVENAEVRRLFQAMGTDGVRNTLGATCWVEALIRTMDDTSLYVVSGVRLRSECDLLRLLGAEVWRVVRPGVGPLNGHSTEVELDGYDVDFTVINDGGLIDLQRRVLWGLHRPYSTTATDALRRADNASFTGGPRNWDVV